MTKKRYDKSTAARFHVNRCRDEAVNIKVSTHTNGTFKASIYTFFSLTKYFNKYLNYNGRLL